MIRFQSPPSHKKLESQIKEAYKVPLEHDIRGSLTCVDAYTLLTGERRHPLAGQPERYVWTTEHQGIGKKYSTVVTQIRCDDDAINTAPASFARILHKIQCDNLLAEAHDLASNLTPELRGPLRMEDVLSAKDQLQAHNPGMDMHLHLDQESFNNIKTSPWVYLTRRSNDASSYDAYRGTIETEREGFKIHLWVVPPSFGQRGFSTVNFMTTHGGILFHEQSQPFLTGESMDFWRGIWNTVIPLENIDVLHQKKDGTDPHCLMHQKFDMAIGDQNAIIRLPDSVEPDPT